MVFSKYENNSDEVDLNYRIEELTKQVRIVRCVGSW